MLIINIELLRSFSKENVFPDCDNIWVKLTVEKKIWNRTSNYANFELMIIYISHML